MLARLLKPTVSSLLCAFLASTAFAATSPVEKRVGHSLLNRSLLCPLSDEKPLASPSRKEAPRYALGSPVPSASPGVLVGNTWYDKQRNGSMRRMITWGTHGDPDTMLVHFHWTYLPAPVYDDRAYMYNAYNVASAMFTGPVAVQADSEYAGYVVIDVTNDNRAILGGHNILHPYPPGGPYQSHFYWDSAPGSCSFDTQCRVPDSVGVGCLVSPYPDDGGHIWPAMCWQEGTDTILHVFAFEVEVGRGAAALAYFRAVNPLTGSCTWDNLYCVDTVESPTEDIDCTDDGRVAIAWNASVPGGEPPHWDQDLYYQINTNSGDINSWLPRVNVTQNVPGVDGWRPYMDVSVLITSDDNLHIVWSARAWEIGNLGIYNNRIFHWSEDHPTIRTVHDANWDPVGCTGGPFSLNACKQTVSECDGKLYVLFVQFNDIPAGVDNDCAHESNPGFPGGAANGELYVAISDDRGLSWDEARNLTNSRTPGCDTAGGPGGPCESDVWPSMAKFGTNYAGQFPDNVVVPAGGSENGWYLDVQYINDHSAGSIVKYYGFWAQADVRWFRLACVEPVHEESLVTTPAEIGYPAWTKHGEKLDTTVTLESIGNCGLTYNVTKQEIIGTPGWLAVSPTSGSIAAGDTVPLTVTLNDNQQNVPGTIIYLQGRLIIDWEAENCDPATTQYDTLPIECWVCDTLYPEVWDTIRTTCTKLIVSTGGNFGKQGIGKYNMDYVDAGDCDEDAEVYVYDGSPILGYVKNGTDTVVSMSIFNVNMADTSGFIPYGDHTPTTDMGDYEVFESGKFVTNDSDIAVEKITYAPKDPDTCSFVIECIKVYLNDESASGIISNLRIGEAIDFDIPCDSGSDNTSGFDGEMSLLYQRGSDRDGESCQPNDNRWGGISFIEGYKNGSRYETEPYGGYLADNPTYVYPSGGFVTHELYGMMGYSRYANASVQDDDLHSVMTFANISSLLPGDTYVFWIIIVTHWNGDIDDFKAEVREAFRWYCGHVSPNLDDCHWGCCNHDGRRGDVNYDMRLNVADLTYLVAYMFKAGPPPPCEPEGDVKGNGGIDIGDLTRLVSYLFKGGPAPPACPPK